MNLQPSVSIRIAAALVALASTAANAAGFTDQELAVRATLDARAPLALSGDGAWRLHVDPHDVLHRVRIADPADESAVQLPPGVQALSASASGQKVALATNPRCVGLVDFGGHAGDAAKVTWLSTATDDALSRGWVPQQPVGCDAEWPAAAIALSSDGSRIATPDAVFDTTTAELLAWLPADSSGTLRLAFVDRDTRLLVARAMPGQRRGGPSVDSGLSISVWDLASKALVNDIETAGAGPSVAASLSLDVSPQTGALFHVQESRRDRSPADSTPLELVQRAPDACNVVPRTRAPVADAAGGAFVVDPWGRWFAVSRPLDPTRDAAELAAGLRSELVVRDIVTGEPVARITSAYALHGLVATPDGATLFALAAQPIDAEFGTAREGWPVVPDAGQLVTLTLPEAAIDAARNPIQPASTGVCKEPGELPYARAMARSERLLAPLWSRDLTADRAVASAMPVRTPATAPDLTKCGAGPEPATFTTPDGGVALDLGAQVARLDPRTGAIVQWLPTPRGRNTCSVVTPSGNGFFSATGDTLTWRPLGAAGDPGRRHVVERRPGWRAELTPAQDGIERVLWSATPAAVVPTAADADPLDLVVADYDANGKRLRESAMNSQSYDDGSDNEGGQPSRLPAPCHDAFGTPLAIGYDWRGGPLGTQRGLTCGPLPGAGRLVWWGGATIAPRAHDTSSRSRPQPAIDGAIAVVADDAQLHVVNLALQREIAQIALGQADTGRRDQAWVLADRRLVLVETTTSDAHRRLRAYALP